MRTTQNLIVPDWPAPNNVKAIQTTRIGGASLAPYDAFNLGMHVKDNAMHVMQNRQQLHQLLPTEPIWLNQTHSTHVVDAANTSSNPDVDASFTSHQHIVCAVMTADCLPLLLCNAAGTKVAAVHAGWRGLCDGVVEATVNKMQSAEKSSFIAWLGPAIGPNAFEVGKEVREKFVLHDAQAALAFKPHGDRYFADLYQLATQRLNRLGITKVYGGGLCTYTDKEKFFSFRRDGDTGRMATLIWLD